MQKLTTQILPGGEIETLSMKVALSLDGMSIKKRVQKIGSKT